MDPQLHQRLAAVPRLDTANRQHTPCKACGGRAMFFDIVDFNKCCSERDVYEFGRAGVPVIYFRCSNCGFLFTKFFDSWSPEDFGRFVYNDDYIRVDGEYSGARPQREAEAMAQRLANDRGLRILDYGSGSGLFAGHLRDRGFAQVSSYDPFSSPERPAGKFDLITCFEVLEHTTDPHKTLADIAGLLEPSGCVIFSTGVQPETINALRCSWWYVAPRNGHASIYTLHALAILGAKFGLTLHAGETNTAFAALDASKSTRRLLSGIGPAQMFYNLAAPGRGEAISAEQATCWHAIEGSPGSTFRWTRESAIPWRLQEGKLQPGNITIRLDVLNEIDAGFIDGCVLRVGRSDLAFRRKGISLVASVTLRSATDPVVTLITPPVLRPSDLRGAGDTRLLGLAVATKI